MLTENLIKEFSQAFGPPGFEDDVLALAQKHLPQGYAARRDSMLNLYIEKEQSPGLPTVLLDAHSDEVGLMVHAVKPDGTLAFTTLGGWTAAALVGQRMLVKNRAGQLVTAVVAAKAPHFGKDDAISLDQLVLDIGASAKAQVEANFAIGPGCPVAPKSDFEQRGDTLIGKAFDDRLGCAAVLEALHKLNGCTLDINLAGTLSSQEEVGLRGAKVCANHVKPAVAICLEGAPADDTLSDSSVSQTALGCGPMLRHMDTSMITNPRLMRFALNIAHEHNIPVQQAIRTRGATNGGSFHLANLGVPTLVIACPVRYVHSHNGIANLSDYNHMVDFTVALVKALNVDIIAGC